MFGLFKSKTPLEKLTAKREGLLAQAHQLMSSNRAASDKKNAEAEEVLKEIELLLAES